MKWGLNGMAFHKSNGLLSSMAVFNLKENIFSNWQQMSLGTINRQKQLCMGTSERLDGIWIGIIFVLAMAAIRAGIGWKTIC